MLHFTSYRTFSAQDRGYRSICLGRYFGIVFLCLIASHFVLKNMGPLLKPNVCVALYSVLQKHVIRKTHFLLKPQEISKKFCIAQVVHELPIFFPAFLHERSMTCALVPFSERWKHTYLAPFCAFFMLPTMFYRKDISNAILQVKLCSFEHRST